VKRPAVTVLAVFLALIAHAAAPDTDNALPVSDGYVLRPLDPTDGKIARPKGWFYKSKGIASGWLCTISAKDPSRGIYETGLRMQLLK
jgi:hypothetical protein